MATVNPFDLLGDDDTDDPSKLIAAAQQLKLSSQTKKPQTPAATQPSSKPAAKLPSKPLPPAQAVKEAREGGRGGGRGTGRGYGRGGRGGGGGFNRESTNSENAFGSNKDSSGGRGPIEEADASKTGERRGGSYGRSRGSLRVGRRGGFGDGEVADDGEQPPRRPYERRSGTGRGYEMKREGAGRGNWGSQADEFSQVVEEVANEGEKLPVAEKTDSAEVDTKEANKDTPANETEKEPENKEMTLEEYEKVLEEKRKALQSLKSEERKVDDKTFATMQPLANKKNNDEIFVKLGSEKDKKKELAEKEERAKKALSINEFLKPTEGERYYSPGGRGRGGRGRGGGGRGGYGGGEISTSNIAAPSIGDPGQFPTLGAK